MGNKLCTSRKQALPLDPSGKDAAPGGERGGQGAATVTLPSGAQPDAQPEAAASAEGTQVAGGAGDAQANGAEAPDDGSSPLLQQGDGAEVQDGPGPLPPNYAAKRRGSVSAEVASLAAQAQQQEAGKPRRSMNTEQVILRAMSHSFLFSDLEEEQKIQCISSMFRKQVHPGEVIIRQGEEGDNFYVIAEGTFTARIAQPDGEQKVVFTYDGRGAFGELALMYNCPRAATVQAESEGLLWGMDRATFRRIILASRMLQRERFERVLADMSVFDSLTPTQRASIADCLELEVVEEGGTVLTEGEELTSQSKFYIVEEGTIACYRTIEGERKLVKEISKGGFFGEVALVTKSAARAATCIAKTRCKLLAMGRDAFERLMGPAEEILQKEIAEYERLNQDLLSQSGKRPGAKASSKPAAKGKSGSPAGKPAAGSKGAKEAAGKEAGRKYSLV